MTTQKKVARRKLSLLELASDLGNVSKDCRMMGCSRQQFYEIRRNFQTYGAEGLIDRLPGAKGPHPNRVSAEIETAILRHALAHPCHGPMRVAHELMLKDNDVPPSFEAQGATIDAVLSDNGREFCGREDRHPYKLFLQLEGIEHKRTRVNRPQSNGIVERLHRTFLDEHFRVEGRKALFETIEEKQIVLDQYLVEDNTKRLHQGRGMNGRTPVIAFIDGIRKEDAPQPKPTKKAA